MPKKLKDTELSTRKTTNFTRRVNIKNDNLKVDALKTTSEPKPKPKEGESNQ